MQILSLVVSLGIDLNTCVCFPVTFIFVAHLNLGSMIATTNGTVTAFDLS